MNEAGAGKKIQTEIGSYPDEAPAILVNAIDLLVG